MEALHTSVASVAGFASVAWPSAAWWRVAWSCANGDGGNSIFDDGGGVDAADDGRGQKQLQGWTYSLQTQTLTLPVWRPA